MNDLVRQKIEEGISVLSDFEPAVGEGGPTMKELEACWEDGKPFDDDASYDAMQHCWLLVREALDMEDAKLTGDLLAAAQVLDDCMIRIYPEEFAPEHRESAAQRFSAGGGTIGRIATMADKLREAANSSNAAQ